MSSKILGSRMARQAALGKMQRREPLSDYEVQLLEVMPTQRKALAEHLEKQRAGELGEPLPEPAEEPRQKGDSKATPKTGTEGSADDTLFQAWVRAQPPEVQSVISRVTTTPDGATFDHTTAQRLAQSGISDKDIAVLLGVDKHTLQAEAKQALELGRTQYRFLLAQRQMSAAMSGDRALLTLLGKHKLGQNDKAADSGSAGSSQEEKDAIRRTKAKLDRMRDGIV
jgi:hypothetical protein